MSTRLICAALLAAFATALPAPAQQPLTLKFARPKQGDTVLVEKVDKTDSKNTIVDKADKVLKELEDRKSVGNFVYRETVLEKPAGATKATKVKRQYLKAEETVNGKAATMSYQGKTVLIEKKGEKYEFRIEGGAELTGAEATKFNNEFNKKGGPTSEDLFALLGEGKSVMVGETWKVDLKALEKMFGGESPIHLDPSSKATATLVKAYRKGSSQFGVLKVDLVLVLKSFTEKGKEFPVEPGSKITALIEVDTAIDGSADVGVATVRGGAHFAIRLPDMPDLRFVVATSGDTTETRKAP
jgi:hypothetical protein